MAGGNGNGGGSSKPWSAIPGSWGSGDPQKQTGYQDAALQLSQEKPGSLVALLTPEPDGGHVFEAAIVLKTKTFKKLKKRVMSGPVVVRVYFDSLAHPESGIVVIYVLVEIEGIKKTFRGFVDLVDMKKHGMLGALNDAAVRGDVNLMFVSDRGKFFHLAIKGHYKELFDSKMEETVLDALERFKEQPWTSDEFFDALSDVDYMLEEVGLKTIDDFIEARRESEAAIDAGMDDDDDIEA